MYVCVCVCVRVCVCIYSVACLKMNFQEAVCPNDSWTGPG